MLRTQISLTGDDRRVLDAAALRRTCGAWAAVGPDGAGWVEQVRSGARLRQDR